MLVWLCMSALERGLALLCGDHTGQLGGLLGIVKPIPRLRASRATKRDLATLVHPDQMCRDCGGIDLGTHDGAAVIDDRRLDVSAQCLSDGLQRPSDLPQVRQRLLPASGLDVLDRPGEHLLHGWQLTCIERFQALPRLLRLPCLLLQTPLSLWLGWLPRVFMLLGVTARGDHEDADGDPNANDLRRHRPVRTGFHSHFLSALVDGPHELVITGHLNGPPTNGVPEKCGFSRARRESIPKPQVD
jgi:hypothetical protein